MNKKISTPIGAIIITILMIAVGGYALWQRQEITKEENKPLPEVQVSEKETIFEEKNIKEEEIANKIIPSRFDEDKIEYLTEDLNNDKKKEIIVITSNNDEGLGYIVIATIIDDEGNYEKVGELEYEGVDPVRGPSIKEAIDINGDNNKEIFIYLGSGGASTANEGLLKWDSINKELDWVKIKNESGKLGDAVFSVGAALTHNHGYIIKDLDLDGIKEIISINGWIEENKSDVLNPREFYFASEGQEGWWWRCEVEIYKWDGSYFSYNSNLLKNINVDVEFRELCAPY